MAREVSAVVEQILCVGAVQSNWIELLKIAGAGGAFWIGLSQYRKSQVWKRVEFVAAEMRFFFDDEAATSARTMLDWRRKELALYKYRKEDDLRSPLVTYAIVASSLGTDSDAHYDKVQSAIRETFERFLEFLARFEGFIHSKVLEKDDFVPYLDYWMKLLAGNDTNSPEVTREVLPQLWNFIHHYGYADVAKFVSRFETIRPEFRVKRTEPHSKNK